MGGWRRGGRGSRTGRGGGGVKGRRRRERGEMWTLDEADSQNWLCHWIGIVDQMGIVDQGVKQVKAGISPQRAQRPQRLERFSLSYLTLEKESFRKLAFTADFERAEILVPQNVGCLRLGFAPEL